MSEQISMSRGEVNEGETLACRKKTAAMAPIDDIRAAPAQNVRRPLKKRFIVVFSLALFRYISNKTAKPIATKGPAGRKYRNRAFGRTQ